MQDVNRAGGIIAIMDELAKAGLVYTSVRRVDGMTLGEAIDEYSITRDVYKRQHIKIIIKAGWLCPANNNQV